MGGTWLGIAGRERRDVIVAFVVLFGILTAHSMLETARDALFLASVPASRLPWVYIGIAVLTFAVVAANSRLASRFRGRRVLSVVLVVAALITAGFWAVADTGGGAGKASLYGFYLWTGLVATIAVSQFWVLLAERFNVGQAKRAYAFIATGGLLGATAGSAGAGAVLQFLPPRHLLIVAPVVLVLTAGATMLLSCVSCGRPADEVAEGTRASRSATLGAAIDHPYVIRLLVLIVVTSITVTAVDLAFKTVVAETIPAAELGQFFASFYAGLNALALAVQLFFASRLLGSLGVNRTLWILPVLLFASALGFVLTLSLLPLLLMKVFDGSLRHSLNRTGSELLFLPLPSALRARAKVFIDGVGGRGGQAIASVGVLVALSFGARPVHLAAAAVVLAAAWFVVVLGLRRPYLELFRQQLREGMFDTRTAVPELDLHSLEALMSALNSEDVSVVVNALDLLVHSGREKVVPALLLYHPAKEVVLRGLELMADAERVDFLAIAKQLMGSLDPEIRAAALRAHTAVQPDVAMLDHAAQDPNALVRTTALVGRFEAGIANRAELETAVDSLIDGEPEGRIALVLAMRNRGRHHPAGSFGDTVVRLAELNEPALRNEIARTIEARPSPERIELLIPFLADRRTRAAARSALRAIGEPALEYLAVALADRDLDPHLRRHLPRTISRFPTARAASILLDYLAEEPRGVVGYKILRGLGRMRANNPALALDKAALERATDLMLRRALDVLAWQTVLSAAYAAHPDRNTQGARLLLLALRENERASVERAFRLLNLINPREDFYIIYQGLEGDSKSRASAQELLEHLVPQPRRAALLALVSDASDASDARRLQAAELFYKPSVHVLEDQMRLLLDDESDAVRALAAHHCGELRMANMRERLSSMREGEPRAIRAVVEEALEALSLVPKGGLHAP